MKKFGIIAVITAVLSCGLMSCSSASGSSVPNYKAFIYVTEDRPMYFIQDLDNNLYYTMSIDTSEKTCIYNTFYNGYTFTEEQGKLIFSSSPNTSTFYLENEKC